MFDHRGRSLALDGLSKGIRLAVQNLNTVIGARNPTARFGIPSAHFSQFCEVRAGAGAPRPPNSA